LETLELNERPPPQIAFRTRFPALDGIRALAVMMVFAFHYGGGTHGGRIMGIVNAIRLQGWAGVDIFFVLSGFLITGVLYDTRHDSQFFRRFSARRALRIFPVYYLVAALLLVLTLIFHYAGQVTHLLFLIYLGNVPIGAILALLLRGDMPDRWRNFWRWLFAAAIGALMVGFTLDPAGSGRWMPTFGFTLIALAAAGLIGWATVSDSVVVRLFTTRPLLLLGRWSYGFYVYHLLFAAGWAALTALLTKRLHSAGVASAIVLTVNFIVTVVVAKWSYDLFEVRFLRWKQRFAYDHVDAAPAIGRTILYKIRNFKTRYQE
jgi:peptidoglycan/LPS O-acetylase OafA/YrhL